MSPSGVRFSQAVGAERALICVHLGGVKNVAVLNALESYWREMFDATVTRQKNGQVVVDCGCGQSIVFSQDSDERPYSGFHLCIYVADWEVSYIKLKERDLLFLNHTFDDKCATLEQAREFHQFRALNVPDEKGAIVYQVGCVLIAVLFFFKKSFFQLELEVRALSHPHFAKERYVSSN